MADSNSDFKLYRYDPSMAAAVIFVILFLGATAIHTWQLLQTRTWYFIPFVIGGYYDADISSTYKRCMSSHQSPNWTVGPYVMQTLLLLIAPTLFAASIYMELGRIILLTKGESYAPIPRRFLTKIFVCGDVISFLMQGAGGGIMASGSVSSLQTGENIIIGGLVVQLLFFLFFIGTAIVFHWRLRLKPANRVWIPWEKHLYTLYSGSCLILIRSLYRLVEYAQGNNGYFMTHEVYIYLFDAVLMLGLMTLFGWVHPSEVNAYLKHGIGGKAVRRVFSVYSPNTDCGI
ncbi:putative RTM1-like protein [Talaromyces proteolyticus]|uniref:RTM1-like protein n=1 Tax=Talaromyces proteolyticus TaxID=1131652 RepID=A0AAD4KVF9_9EURO|nr:putative RTM1-like protein [Talaromyces proteolyticus]KAH8700719.1 putative RTM1-like protein [Talaromyces proteolyticus]